MQNFVETASIVLSDNDISTSDDYNPAGVSNSVGYQNAIRSSRTWYNVNIKDVVGDDMYHKYEYYNIRLNAISYGPTPEDFGGNDPNNLLVNAIMTGLPFAQNTYNYFRRNTTNQANICSLVMNQDPSSSTALQFDSTWLVTFRRCENLDLTIFFRKPDNTPYEQESIPQMFPRFTFYFSIFPVR